MNKKTRDRLYPLLVARDGEKCKICTEPGTTETLVIDHIDNDNRNNAFENLQLLCRSDNNIKNPRGKSKKLLSPERESESEIERENTKPAAMEKNEECQPIFRRWLFKVMTEKSAVNEDLLVSECVNAGAEVANCSQQAVRRYLARVTSFVQMYYVTKNQKGKDVLRFRPEYDPKLHPIPEKVKAVVKEVV